LVPLGAMYSVVAVVAGPCWFLKLAEGRTVLVLDHGRDLVVPRWNLFDVGAMGTWGSRCCVFDLATAVYPQFVAPMLLALLLLSFYLCWWQHRDALP